MGLYDELRRTSGTSGDGVVNGVVTGIVKENYNKDDPGKVKVEMFLGEEGKNVTGWVPVMNAYSGDNFGVFTLPEVGSEVVVAFNMGDRNKPIVIGCLWSGKNKMPTDTAVEGNVKKRFITKGENEILIDDTSDKQKIKIKTKKGRYILLDDENDSMKMQDKDGKNLVVIDSKKSEITIEAEKKITLKVGGTDALTLDGSGKKAVLTSTNVEVKAASKLELKGQTLNAEGTSTTVSGSGSLQLKSSSITQLKGSMVKIN